MTLLPGDSARSSTGNWMDWGQTGAPAPTATCRRTVSSSRRPASRQDSSFSSGGGGGIPTADDPLFRPIDADDFRINGDDAGDFSNLRQNGLVRITFPLPPNIRLIDPATNEPSSETEVDVWRAVPTVNDVALTGRDDGILWPRGPNEAGGYQLDARFSTLQEQALAALTNHAQIQSAPLQQILDDLSSFQRVLFTNARVRALSDAVREGTLPLPDPDRRLTALEQQGKVVFERACAQCHGGPGQSTPQATPNNPPAPVIRFHNILSQCPRPVDPTARYVFAACPPRLARKYELTRSRCRLRHRAQGESPAGRGHRSPYVVRSRPCAPDRFVGGPAPRDDGKSSTCLGFEASVRLHRTFSTTARPRSKRCSITTTRCSSAPR